MIMPTKSKKAEKLQQLKQHAYGMGTDELVNLLTDPGNNYRDALKAIIEGAEADVASKSENGEDTFRRHHKDDVLTELAKGTGPFAGLRLDIDYRGRVINKPRVEQKKIPLGDLRQEALPSNSAKMESALKKKIRKIKKTRDPGERLLRYKALRESLAGTYDTTLALPEEKRDEHKNWHKGGFGTGIFLGAMVAFVAAGTATTGAGFIVAAVALLGGPIIGERLGSIGRYGRTPQQKHATRMVEMVSRIDDSLHTSKSYMSRRKYEKNMRALEKSAYFDQVTKEFPSLEYAFNQRAENAREERERQAAVTAREEEFLTQDTGRQPVSISPGRMQPVLNSPGRYSGSV
jgi:hypothetical protein